MTDRAERVVRRGRREVRLSSANRILFPKDGVTKGDLWDYYAAVAPTLVPHLRHRPFTMKRFRDGAAGPSFFQKNAPKGMPDWIPTRRFRTWPREVESRLVDFPLVNDELALLWMVQMHCIDMNAWYSRVDRPERPDFVLFDLDPPDGGFRLGVRVAHLVRGLLEELGLSSHVKTSGADGVHVLVPITRRSTFEDTRDFADGVATVLAERNPGLVTT
ncbi:MAG: DNA polymerase domain-containing protein, partial [Candidatus Rokuibacteriota bacterium]